jgi:hemerythrin superfamily protein
MTDGDVVELLLEQHKQVRSLFKGLLGPNARRDDWDTLLRLLAVHETAEEEVVYPALKGLGDEANAVAEARKQEEDKAKKELSDLEALGFDGEGFMTRLADFRTAVEAHADSEEREVFPRLRSGLEQGTLDTMRAALVAAEALAPTHPHPHAPESAVGNIVAGPMVALVDRVRDAIRAVRK